FHHFAAPGCLPAHGRLVSVPTRVTPERRHAMTEALAAHGIDLLVLGSPWPETFSYVAHEAMAAGTDLVALADGGNVPDAVRRHRGGVVLRDAEAAVRFFTSGAAIGLVRAREAAGRRRFALERSGTTATVAIEAVP
ncbi:MAG TPA: hypothetical protein VGC80_17280, partial [Acetobacteraceae bacterium]